MSSNWDYWRENLGKVSNWSSASSSAVVFSYFKKIKNLKNLLFQVWAIWASIITSSLKKKNNIFIHSYILTILSKLKAFQKLCKI